MARLELFNQDDGRLVVVTLSRRNLLALLHKLDMPGSMRTLTNNDCFEDGVQTPLPDDAGVSDDMKPTVLVLRCEDDAEHYGRRELGPGLMHPATETFVLRRGGAAGEVPSIEVEPNDG